MRVQVTFTLAVVVALACVLIGSALAWRQHRLITRAGTVNAVVRDASRADLYVRIVYEYQLGPTRHVRDRLTPLPPVTRFAMPATGDLLAAFPQGATVAAHLPAGSTEAYLLRRAQAYPALLVWFGCAIGLVMMGLTRRSGLMDAGPAPQRQRDSEWSLLTRARSPEDAVTGRLFEAFGWFAVSIGCALAYLLTAPPGIDPLIALCALGLFPATTAAIGAWRWARLNEALGEVEVTTMKPVLELDQPTIAQVRVTARKPLPLREARLALVCRRRRGLGTSRLFVSSQPVLHDRELSPRQPCAERCVFEVARAKRRSSSAFERFVFPRVEWCFELHLHPQAGGRYIVRFPVQVRTSAEAKPTTRGAAHPVAA